MAKGVLGQANKPANSPGLAGPRWRSVPVCGRQLNWTVESGVWLVQQCSSNTPFGWAVFNPAGGPCPLDPPFVSTGLINPGWCWPPRHIIFWFRSSLPGVGMLLKVDREKTADPQHKYNHFSICSLVLTAMQRQNVSTAEICMGV